MAPHLAVATVRRGHEIIHLYNENVVLKYLQQPQPSPSHGSGEVQRSVLDHAADAAQSCLDIASDRLQLKQPASKLFGTALRTATLREQLAGITCNDGTPLVKQLGYISCASDAKRHLSVSSIAEAASLLDKHLLPVAQRNVDQRPSPSVDPSLAGLTKALHPQQQEAEVLNHGPLPMTHGRMSNVQRPEKSGNQPRHRRGQASLPPF